MNDLGALFSLQYNFYLEAYEETINESNVYEDESIERDFLVYKSYTTFDSY